jgi:hypothetical protein
MRTFAAKWCKQRLMLWTPGILLRRCSLDMLTNYLRSDYHGCCVAAKDGKQLAQTAGDQYFFIIFNTMFAFALLHLGQWRELEQTVSAALMMSEKNANRQGSVLCRLTLGWLYAEALDFESAKKCCDEVLNPTVEANPFAYFIGRNLLAKACVGLRNYPGALAQFQEIQCRVDEADGVGMDSTIYLTFIPTFVSTGSRLGIWPEPAKKRRGSTRFRYCRQNGLISRFRIGCWPRLLWPKRRLRKPESTYCELFR